MDRRKFLKAGAVSLGGLSLPASLLGGRAWAAEAWDMACEFNETSFQVQMDRRFVIRLKELTRGAIAITISPGGALGYRSKDQFDAVGDGAVQLADTLSSQLGGINPFFNLSSLPFLAKSMEDAGRLWRVSRPYYERIFAEGKQKLLYANSDLPSAIWAKKPIRRLEDLKNLRIRTYDVNGSMTFKAAGAAPIQVSWGDLIPTLSTGGLDAVLTGAEGGVLLKLWEYLPVCNEVNYTMPLHIRHLNAKVYDRLGPDLKAAVNQAAKEVDTYIWSSHAERRRLAYEKIVANGTTIVSDFPDAFRSALQDAGRGPRERWLKDTGDAGKKLMAEYLGART